MTFELSLVRSGWLIFQEHQLVNTQSFIHADLISLTEPAPESSLTSTEYRLQPSWGKTNRFLLNVSISTEYERCRRWITCQNMLTEFLFMSDAGGWRVNSTQCSSWETGYYAKTQNKTSALFSKWMPVCAADCIIGGKTPMNTINEEVLIVEVQLCANWQDLVGCRHTRCHKFTHVLARPRNSRCKACHNRWIWED